MNTQPIGASAPTTPSSGAAQAAVSVRGNANGAAQAAQDGTASGEPVNSNESRDPRSLQYQVDSGSRQIVATIVDDSNQTVIVQIPDAEVLRIAKAIDRMQGFLIDHKA